jgi:deoxyribodipyrimidine photolyase-related protein
MEFFYREMRRATGLLMEAPDEPTGGQCELRPGQPRAPAARPPPARAAPLPARRRDAGGHGAGRARIPDHFGTLDAFAWPVTAEDAEDALADFVEHRLPVRPLPGRDGGRRADAVPRAGRRSAECRHARPARACAAAEPRTAPGDAPLNAVEGFIRQILGWREYVRGIYWLRMPAYRDSNALEATRTLPWFYWSGETEMACLRAAIAQTAGLAYAHHIQRLMVTGNFALLAGSTPRR